jgi:hypothetical protein
VEGIESASRSPGTILDGGMLKQVNLYIMFILYQGNVKGGMRRKCYTIYAVHIYNTLMLNVENIPAPLTSFTLNLGMEHRPATVRSKSQNYPNNLVSSSNMI